MGKKNQAPFQRYVVDNPVVDNYKDELLVQQEQDYIKADLKICPVKWIDEVLEIALQYLPKPDAEGENKEPIEASNKKKPSKKQISTH